MGKQKPSGPATRLLVSTMSWEPLEGQYGRVTATATLNEQTKQTEAEVYVPWGTLPASVVGDAIRQLQVAVEWVLDEANKLASR